jgi:integrase/recombinase XerC
MLDAGLRVGEVIRLQISDVWFNNEPVTSLDIGDGVAEKDCTRRIPASARLSAAIIEAAFWLWMEDGEPKRGFAFYQGLPLRAITTRQIERFIRAAAEKVLQRPIHPHMLRHTFGTRLMRKTNARVVQELLGHKHLSSTQIYMNPNGDDLKGAIEAIDVEV